MCWFKYSVSVRLPTYIVQGALPPVSSFSVRGYTPTTSASRSDELGYNGVLQLLSFPLRFSKEKGQSLSSINKITTSNSSFVFLEMHLYNKGMVRPPPKPQCHLEK